MKNSKLIKYTIEYDGDEFNIGVKVPSNTLVADTVYALCTGVDEIINELSKDTDGLSREKFISFLTEYLDKEVDKEG